MTDNLFLSEIMFAVIVTVGALVLREFIRTKNGTLRKIFIAYFSVEIFIYLCSAIYFYAVERLGFKMSVDVFRVIVLLPKVVIKLVLFWYLVKVKRNE